MNDRVVEFRIGVMVLATLIITVILISLFGPRESIWPFQGRYTIEVVFPSAPGVREDTPVLKSGVAIGRVSEVKLVNQDRETLVTLEIDNDRTVYDDEVCRINRSLLGDSELEFVKQPPKEAPQPQVVPVDQGAAGAQAVPGPRVAKPVPRGGPPLPGEVSHDPSRVVSDLQDELLRAVHSVEQTSGTLGHFIERVNAVLGADEDVEVSRERLKKLFEQAQLTMESIQKLSDSAYGLIGDPQLRQRLYDSLAAVPDLMQKTQTAIGSVEGAMTKLDNNLDNITGFTESIGKDGKAMLADLRTTAQGLNRAMFEIETFMRALNNPQGSLGLLVNDPQLYQNLNQTVAGINQTMVNVNEMTQRLEPILNDARIFSDKIARHPELLGVRGALAPESGVKGAPVLSFQR